MKTQDFGWSPPTGASCGGPQGSWFEDKAKRNYQENRANGGNEDSPARDIPLDGNCSNWIQCRDRATLPRPLADGSYKEGYFGSAWYRTRYQEGPDDKAWMEERDGNYLARLERVGQAKKAACLRASLPTSHPHYRALTPLVPAPSPPSRNSTPLLPGQGAGAGAAAPSPTPSSTSLPPAAGAGMAAPADPLARPFELRAAGDHRQAIRLLDAYLRGHPASMRAHRFRGFSRMKLATSASSKAQKQALLESAKADYLYVLGVDPLNNEAADALDTIDQQLASSPLAGAGAGVGAAPVPAKILFQAAGRVWGGKYIRVGTQPEYVAHAKKTEGCAIGAVYRKTPCKPGASHAGKLWLGKVGIARSERDVSVLLTRCHMRHGSSVDAIHEKIAADSYVLLSRGMYIVPKHRLATLPILNEFTRSDPVALGLVEQMNLGRTDRIETTVHLMSKLIDGYQNLGTASVKNPDGSIGPLMAYVEAQHTVPEQLIVDGREIPLLGLMEILAAARLLSDTDVLGGGGKNAGFVVERDAGGMPIAARAVKINVGNAFNFHGGDNRLFQSFKSMASKPSRLANRVDIQFGNQESFDIEWVKLTDRQRIAFLDALDSGLKILQAPLAMKYLINREGEFNRAEAGLLTEDVVTSIIEVWQANLTMQARDRSYGPMLTELVARASPSP